MAKSQAVEKPINALYDDARAGFDSQYFRDAYPLAILYLNDRERRIEGARRTNSKRQAQARKERPDFRIPHPLEGRVLELLKRYKPHLKVFEAHRRIAAELGISMSALEKKIVTPAHLGGRIPRYSKL
jgi:hypothetical protein